MTLLIGVFSLADLEFVRLVLLFSDIELVRVVLLFVM